MYFKLHLFHLHSASGLAAAAPLSFARLADRLSAQILLLLSWIVAIQAASDEYV